MNRYFLIAIATMSFWQSAWTAGSIQPVTEDCEPELLKIIEFSRAYFAAENYYFRYLSRSYEGDRWGIGLRSEFWYMSGNYYYRNPHMETFSNGVERITIMHESGTVIKETIPPGTEPESATVGVDQLNGVLDSLERTASRVECVPTDKPDSYRMQVDFQPYVVAQPINFLESITLEYLGSGELKSTLMEFEHHTENELKYELVYEEFVDNLKRFPKEADQLKKYLDHQEIPGYVIRDFRAKK